MYCSELRRQLSENDGVNPNESLWTAMIDRRTITALFARPTSACMMPVKHARPNKDGFSSRLFPAQKIMTDRASQASNPVRRRADAGTCGCFANATLCGL